MTDLQGSTEIYSLSATSATRDKFDTWVTDYIFDYAVSLKEMEARRPIFRKWSPQLNFRCGLVDYVKAVSDLLKFSQVTRHRAIYMIDEFMDNGHYIREPYFKLFAIVCLILAAKHEENESLIPKLSTLQNYVDVNFTRKDFVTLEITVMKYFNWRLSMPTAVNFTEHHCLFAVFPNDAAALGYSTKNLRAIVRGLTYDYLDVTLSELSFLSYPPSKVGAICLRAARVTLKLTPAWPDLLRVSTGYCEEDLLSGYKLLMRSILLPERKRKSEFGSPESGYGTDSHSTESPNLNKRVR